MAKAELKTKVNTASVDAFIDKQPEPVATDCRAIIKLMKKATGEEPKMWGASIVGYGRYAYEGAGGRSGEWIKYRVHSNSGLIFPHGHRACTPTALRRLPGRILVQRFLKH